MHTSYKASNEGRQIDIRDSVERLHLDFSAVTDGDRKLLARIRRELNENQNPHKRVVGVVLEFEE